MKKKNKHELDQEKNKGKTSRNDLLIRPVLHNTAPVTRKATLHYKSLFHKELKEAERTQKSIKVQRRAPFPLRGSFLSKHWLTNAGTVRLPGRGHFLLSLELVCWENDFPISVCRERFYRKSRVFFHSGNNLIHPSTYGSRGRLPVAASASKKLSGWTKDQTSPLPPRENTAPPIPTAPLRHQADTGKKHSAQLIGSTK